MQPTKYPIAPLFLAMLGAACAPQLRPSSPAPQATLAAPLPVSPVAPVVTAVPEPGAAPTVAPTPPPVEEAQAAPIVPLAKPLQIVEAEDGTFTGTVDRHCCWRSVMLSDLPHSTHSGKGFVDAKNVVGSYIEVNVTVRTAGQHNLSIRYTHVKKEDRSAELRVNGAVTNPSVAFPQTPAWTVWQTVNRQVDLKAGPNVLRLTALQSGGLANIDYFKVSEIKASSPDLPRVWLLEAEEGVFTGIVDGHSCWHSIAQVAAVHSAFTGKGFVDIKNELGSYIEVPVTAPSAGAYELAVRYVHAKNDERPAEVKVNGVVENPSLTFPSTHAWTAWQSVSTKVQLKAGKNIIRLTAKNAGGLANIDHLAIAAAPQ